ncbi:MAG: hypothetical protein J5793_05090 [Clostridia bacterium]|nr:hypothetical protein [Clostridia bacterium]
MIFFFGLTKIKISTFVLISTVARIPSIVTSTIGGHLIQDKNYLAAVILYVVVGAVSLACLLLYRKILDALKKRTDKKETPEKDKNPEESGTESTNKEETKDVSNGPDGL